MSDEDDIVEGTRAGREDVDLARRDAEEARRGAEETRREPPRSGHYIGVYRIEKRLAKGGMGRVFLAHDDRLGRPVAIKQIRSDKAPGSKQRARLRREARAVARLNHPAIAQVHDVVYDEDGDSIVMEYVEGKNVGQLLAAGKLDGKLALSVAIQVAQGLAAAHAYGMVHRDLKAENVMVRTADAAHPGRAKILDFGLVKKVSPETTADSLTERGLLLGTVGSMSPEQATGRKVDERSDLFSFGVLLYEMFTGYSPFRRDRWLDSLEAVKTERQVPARTLRPELPSELSGLIDRLLEKNPAHRPQDARQVAELLTGLAATTVIDELPAPRVRAVEKPDRFASGASEESSSPDTAARRRGWLGRLQPSLVSVAFLALATLALLAGKAFLVEDPTRVLIFEPELRTLESAEDYGAVVAMVRRAARDTLARFDHLAVVDYSATIGEADDPAEQARRAGATEALVSQLVCRGKTCDAELSLIRASDGKVIASERFVIPAGATDGGAESMVRRLRSLFAEDR